MSDSDASEPTLDQFIAKEIDGEDVRAAARRAFTFLSACVDGQVPEAKVSDQVQAAKALLDHAARLPDLLGELAGIAELAGEDDVAVIITALE